MQALRLLGLLGMLSLLCLLNCRVDQAQRIYQFASGQWCGGEGGSAALDPHYVLIRGLLDFQGMYGVFISDHYQNVATLRVTKGVYLFVLKIVRKCPYDDLHSEFQ